jgi:hypothetical protein
LLVFGKKEEQTTPPLNLNLPSEFLHYRECQQMMNETEILIFTNQTTISLEVNLLG